MPLYFAYGSNMDRAAMARRCPHSRAIGVARLMRHRFFISADGYATITRDPQRTVWGLLWDLALADVPALDRYESIGTGLYAKTIQPVLSERGPRQAMLYVGRSLDPGAPKAGYLEAVIAAASDAGLPEPYLRELQAALPKAAPVEPAAEPQVRPRWAAPTGVRRSR